jgi:Spy/CpxP family protein refolding chaperone
VSIRNVLIPAALAFAVIVPVATFAQQAQAPAGTAAPRGQWQGQGHHRGGGMMRMMRDLNLSDQQKTQIRQIMQQFRQSHQGQRPDAQARQQLRDQIMSVLTPQQRTQFQAKLQRMRERRTHPEPGSTTQP